MTILMNQGVYIDTIVESVMENMIVGAILAVLILILFLKDIKPTLVIACSIPLSVVFAIVLMYFTGILWFLAINSTAALKERFSFSIINVMESPPRLQLKQWKRFLLGVTAKEPVLSE